MNLNTTKKRTWLLAILIITTLIASACNLGAPESDQVEITNAPTNTGVAPTRTLLPTGSAATAVNVTSIPFPTQQVQQPTQVVQLPPTTNNTTKAQEHAKEETPTTPTENPTTTPTLCEPKESQPPPCGETAGELVYPGPQGYAYCAQTKYPSG